MHASEAAAYALLQAMHADAAQGGRMHHHSGARGALTPTPHGHHGGAYGYSASAPATPSGSLAAAGAVYGCTVMVSMAKERQTQFGKL